MIPMSAQTVDESLVMTSDVYRMAAGLVFKKYGMRLLTADEGGLAPPFKTVEEMFSLAVESIERAGYTPGKDVFLGVDVASTHFYKGNRYELDSSILDSDAMIKTIAGWLDRFPVVSVEDGLSEDDWNHWPKLCQANAGKALTLGDDLLCTNPERIRRAVEAGACDALLLKVNQIGTLTEALAAYGQARSAGWSVTLSVRSGETEDDWAADLAVGWQADQFASRSGSRNTIASSRLRRRTNGDSRTGPSGSRIRVSPRLNAPFRHFTSHGGPGMFDRREIFRAPSPPVLACCQGVFDGLSLIGRTFLRFGRDQCEGGHRHSE